MANTKKIEIEIPAHIDEMDEMSIQLSLEKIVEKSDIKELCKVATLPDETFKKAMGYLKSV